MLRLLTLLPLVVSSTVAMAGGDTTTTEAPVNPGPEASLEEVWTWMSSVASSAGPDGALNINMWMSGNKMSMNQTIFTMDIGDEEEEAANRAMDPEAGPEGLESYSWSWADSPVGGTINMYMYNNSMSMENTVFTLATRAGTTAMAADSEMEVKGGITSTPAGATTVMIICHYLESRCSIYLTLCIPACMPYMPGMKSVRYIEHLGSKLCQIIMTVVAIARAR